MVEAQAAETLPWQPSGGADWFALPVRKPHLLSSGVAGLMAAHRSDPVMEHSSQLRNGMDSDSAARYGALGIPVFRVGIAEVPGGCRYQVAAGTLASQKSSTTSIFIRRAFLRWARATGLYAPLCRRMPPACAAAVASRMPAIHGQFLTLESGLRRRTTSVNLSAMAPSY
jgi:hypothetical protein